VKLYGAAVLLTALAGGIHLACADDAVFESLGVPCTVKGLSFRLVTNDPDGRCIAWTGYEAPGKMAMLGVRTDTGETVWVDLAKYGRSHVQMTKGKDGNVYLYAGKPSHFFRYDVARNELVDLGVPAKPAHYFGSGMLGPDGKYYIGSYPATYLVRCDTMTGGIECLGRIAEDPRQCYIFPRLAVSDAGVVYCPVGLHHRELWAYDTRTGRKRQILPSPMTESQGRPTVWLGEDGQVYGRAGSTEFLCRPDRIATDAGILPDARGRAPPHVANGKKVGGLDRKGRLKLIDAKTGEATYVQTAYKGKPLMIYSVGCERDGRIWGGTLFPSMTFSCDLQTGELTDHGRIARGRCQVYDIINVDRGLLMSSYTGAYMDLWDPARPREKGGNPLSFKHNPRQERPMQWARGPDGYIYIGTIPVKGHLGGALARLDPSDVSIAWWDNIVKNQSIRYCAPVPATGELICATSIGGGSSAKPTETEAYVFLWDCKQEKISHMARPVRKTRHYGRVVTAAQGIVYGLAGPKYYAFDPVKRETIFVGDLPVRGLHFPELNDEVVGAKGLIYGLADDAVFAIDPSDHSIRIIARHDSIRKAHGFYVTPDGTLYYGSQETLWRCKLPEVHRN